MRPKKVTCPICGETMEAESWGMKRTIYRSLCGGLVPRETVNYVNYICSCGNRVEYEGTEDCWEKCNNCVNFQDHYPYEAKDNDR